ncbi:MAG: EFR1 family ferrodoxin [Bacteroides sp.]|nr:EFR1 family ferrodoxin [Bacteroides sp.]
MQIPEINAVYFSATKTTRKIVRTITHQFTGKINEYDITQSSLAENIIIGSENLLLVGVPVYAGRIPAIAIDALNRFKGNNTPAVIICVYGNRDYDDALLEMKDLVENNGFKVISAAAFIAQHSIFPKVGQNRPDEKDFIKIDEFGTKTAGILKSITDITTLPDLEVKGNRPYKTPGKIPLQPKGDKKCIECGTCVKRCPVKAIPTDNPRKTEKDLCISCGRCIVVCPQKARHYGGLLYKLAGNKFIKANSERKEPTVVFSNGNVQ